MSSAPDETAYQRIFRRNRAWVAEVTRTDPEFFARSARGQQPTFLFIGCSDSRVPAELLTGARPGEMFVHRNVANLALHADVNLLSVLSYAVDALKVQAVIVCGHQGCGGVRAAMDAERAGATHGFVDHWIRGVRDVMRLHAPALDALPDDEVRYRRLVELNAAEQAFNLRRSPVVRAAWARGQALAVHAMVYDVADGLLRDLSPASDDGADVTAARASAWVEGYEARER